MLTLTDLLRGTGGQLAPGHEGDVTFARAVIDSREVRPGDLFVALKGEHVDGHEFIPHAIANHAAGILSSRPPGSIPNRLAFVQVRDTLVALQELASFKLRQVEPLVIGITGSVGKTSTKEIVAGTLALKRPVLKTARNLNTEIGVPLMLLQLEPEHEIAVLEMGMYVPGDIRFLAELTRPKIGVVTNVGHVHAERVGTIEQIAEAKAELVDGLPRDGLAILNGDNPFTSAMAGRGKPSMLFGLGDGNDVRASDVKAIGLEGISFSLQWQGQTIPIRSSLLGEHSVYHALAAAAVMLSLDYSLEEAATALAAYRSEALRMRILSGINSMTVLDDTYNSSPPAVEAALLLLSQIPSALKRVAVLGDMLELGRYSQDLHRQVGGKAARLVDLLVTVGNEARFIADGAKAAGMPSDCLFVAPTPEEAISFLRTHLGQGDALLVKGSRAMGLERIVQEFVLS